jgi:hypothetical protein
MRVLRTIVPVAILICAGLLPVPGQPPAGAGKGKGGPGAAGAAGAKGKGGRVVPPARIMEFRAESVNLKAEESTVLVWAVENPTSTVVSGIGPVQPRGSQRVYPKQSTIYTLTLRGPAGTETRDVIVKVEGSGEPVAAVTPTLDVAKPTPRLANGKPDLTGVYNGASFSSMFGGRATRGENDPFTGKLKPGAESYRVVRGPKDAGLFANCDPTGVPEAYFVPYQWQIVSHPDYVVIMYEYPHLFRVIPIASAGKPAEHPLDPDPTWMGHSVAKWEGDTLVVDAVGFNDRTQLPGNFKHSEALHVIERFTRTDSLNLEYEATIDDPNVFVEPWKISRGYPLRPDLTTVTEFICENNRDYGVLFEEQEKK